MELTTQKAIRFLLEHGNFHAQQRTKKDLKIYDLTTIRLGKYFKFELKVKSYSLETSELLNVLIEEQVNVPVEKLNILIFLDFQSEKCKCFAKFKDTSNIFGEEISKAISKVKFLYRNLSAEIFGHDPARHGTFTRTIRCYNK